MNGYKRASSNQDFYANLESRCRRALDRRRSYEEARSNIHLEVLATVREVERARIGHAPEIIRYDIYGSTAEVDATWYSPSIDRRGRVRFPLLLVYNAAELAKWKEAVAAMEPPDEEPEIESEQQIDEKTM